MEGTEARRHEGTKDNHFKKRLTRSSMMGEIRTFRDLIAWQRGMELGRAVHQASKQLSQKKEFILADQMWRAGVSVPSNIAEGYGRQSTKDYLKHLRIARGSLAELFTQVQLAMDLEILSRDQQLIRLLEETDRILQGLIRSLEAK